MLGLPDGVKACLFDLDGVLTDTASVHAKAWKQAFDAALPDLPGDGDRSPFALPEDYNAHVDGKPRADGVRDFLTARGFQPSEAEVQRIGDGKNKLVLELIDRDGVKVYDGSVAFVRAAREQGLRTAVVSSSANTRQVLEVTGLADLFEARVDGVTIVEEHLKGKPAPDSFLRGAELLGVTPAQACVFEDALAGVQAGRAGHFGHVVGVDRVGHRDGLLEHGADEVVDDLSELLA